MLVLEDPISVQEVIAYDYDQSNVHEHVMSYGLELADVIHSNSQN